MLRNNSRAKEAINQEFSFIGFQTNQDKELSDFPPYFRFFAWRLPIAMTPLAE